MQGDNLVVGGTGWRQIEHVGCWLEKQMTAKQASCRLKAGDDG